MKTFFTLLRHELRTLFLAPATYTAAVLFLLLMGLIFYLNLEEFCRVAKEEMPMTEFFRAFFIPVFFMVPLLTMKSIAEERRQGTLATLMTTPVSASAVVLSKFSAAYLFYCGLWALTLGFPVITARSMENDFVGSRLLETGPLLGGYLFIAVSGVLFIAVDIFCSSLTRSQLVAGMLTFSAIFIIVLGIPLLFERMTQLQEWLRQPMDYLQVTGHLDDFSRGVIDTRPFFYYLSNSILVLGLAVLVSESKA